MQGGCSHTCEGGAKTQVELHLPTSDGSEEEVDERGGEPGERTAREEGDCLK